ncbi:PspC domain-containing protein [Roseiflexus sp.]
MPVSNFWGNIMDISTSRLMRSRHDAMIAGVAGGIAGYLGVDSTIVRLVFVALLFTGVGALLYPALWIIMPLEAPQNRGQGDQRQVSESSGADCSDPITGAAAGSESEIPIKNLNEHGRAQSSLYVQRNRQLGVILIGVGVLVLLSIVLGPAFGRLLFPLALIVAGAMILMRSR